MKPKINYDKVFSDLLKHKKENASLLLHVCCAPCSTAVLERLVKDFKVTLFFDNPNIYPSEEYTLRKKECEALVDYLSLYSVTMIETLYEPKRFYEAVKNYSHLKEGSARCFSCYRMRLEETAKYAASEGYDYFGTTLSISPHKNAQVLNFLGEKLEKAYGISYLYSDFKKQGGFKRSLELSEQYGFYRQDYCGCAYSKMEAEARQAKQSPKPVDKSVE